MAVSLPDARQLSDEVLEALRLRALRGCELGFSEADVAELLGVARETVSRWWTAYAAGGLPGSGEALVDGLRRRRPGGHPRRPDRASRRHRADPLGRAGPPHPGPD